MYRLFALAVAHDLIGRNHPWLLSQDGVALVWEAEERRDTRTVKESLKGRRTRFREGSSEGVTCWCIELQGTKQSRIPAGARRKKSAERLGENWRRLLVSLLSLSLAGRIFPSLGPFQAGKGKNMHKKPKSLIFLLQ